MAAKPKGEPDTTRVFPLQTAEPRRCEGGDGAFGSGCCCGGWRAWGHQPGGHPNSTPNGLPGAQQFPASGDRGVSPRKAGQMSITAWWLFLLHPQWLLVCPSLSSLTPVTPVSPVSLWMGSPLCIF